MPTNPISGFVIGDAIDLATVGFSSGGSVALGGGNALQVREGGQSYTLQLDPGQSFTGEQFILSSDGGSGTSITVTGPPAPVLTGLGRRPTVGLPLLVKGMGMSGDSVAIYADGGLTPVGVGTVGGCLNRRASARARWRTG